MELERSALLAAAAKTGPFNVSVPCRLTCPWGAAALRGDPGAVWGLGGEREPGQRSADLAVAGRAERGPGGFSHPHASSARTVRTHCPVRPLL